MDNNPASNNVTAQFGPTNDAQTLPDALRLSSEKTGPVKEVPIRGQYAERAMKEGLNIDFDVHSLPRGTYYLQGIYDTEKSESVRIILQ